MPVKPGLFASALLAFAVALPLAAQQPATSALEPSVQLIRDVIYNEMHDPERSSHWQYLSACSTPGQTLVREQVETAQGPIFRLLEKNGALLDAAQERQETARLDKYLQDPAQIARVLHNHQEDEARLASIMKMLPDAFLFRYQDPPSRDVVRIAFRPNPAFVPTGYEARIIHALTGVILVDVRMKRMIDMRGTLASRVDFGYGLLGHVDQGGTFEIHRRQVSATHWKTDLVDVHVQGKILMLKTVSKEEREVRSDFRPVPVATTLLQASQLLDQDASNPGLLAQVSPVYTSSIQSLSVVNSDP